MCHIFCLNIWAVIISLYICHAIPLFGATLLAKRGCLSEIIDACAARLSAGFLFDIESIYSNKITDIRSNVIICHIFCLNIWFVINYLYICGVFTTIRVSFPRGVRLTLRLRKEDFLSSFFYLMRLLNRHVPAYADNSPPSQSSKKCLVHRQKNFEALTTNVKASTSNKTCYYEKEPHNHCEAIFNIWKL